MIQSNLIYNAFVDQKFKIKRFYFKHIFKGEKTLQATFRQMFENACIQNLSPKVCKLSSLKNVARTLF